MLGRKFLLREKNYWWPQGGHCQPKTPPPHTHTPTSPLRISLLSNMKLDRSHRFLGGRGSFRFKPEKRQVKFRSENTDRLYSTVIPLRLWSFTNIYLYILWSAVILRNIKNSKGPGKSNISSPHILRILKDIVVAWGFHAHIAHSHSWRWKRKTLTFFCKGIFICLLPIILKEEVEDKPHMLWYDTRWLCQ